VYFELGLCKKVTLCVLQQGPGSGPSLPLERSPLWGVLHVVEGLALVVLCSCRPATRRLAVNVLKEVRALHTALGIAKVTTNSLIDGGLKVTKIMRCSVSQVRCKRHIDGYCLLFSGR
jgi:hypothetical protein